MIPPSACQQWSPDERSGLAQDRPWHRVSYTTPRDTINPDEISYGVGNLEIGLQISPNLVGFQQVLQIIALQAKAKKKAVRSIIVDRQNEFNKAQAELSKWYRNLIGHDMNLGPGMPSFDFKYMPAVPPTFMAGDASFGLELVDVTLWIAKRIHEEKSVSPELHRLFWCQARRGLTDEVSLDAIEKRWSPVLLTPDTFPADPDIH